MFSRPYSRRLEAEADQVGLQLAAKVYSSVQNTKLYIETLKRCVTFSLLRVRQLKDTWSAFDLLTN